MKKLLILVFAMSLSGGVLACQREEEIVIQETQRPVTQLKQLKDNEQSCARRLTRSMSLMGGYTQHYLKVGEDEWGVPKKFLQQCEVYSTQQNFEDIQKKQVTCTKGLAAVSLCSHSVREFEDVYPKKEKLSQEKLIKRVWDITTLTQELPKDVRNKISALIAVASGEKNPSVISKEELFKIIKLADALQHTKGMRRCIPVFMDRVVAGNPLHALVRTLTAPQGKEHTFCVRTLISLPGTELVVSGGGDGKLKVWNCGTGEWVCDWIAPQGKKHADGVNTLVLLPNTNLIVSGGGDCKLKVWDVDPFANLTLDQITLCDQIFTSQVPVDLVKDADNRETFMSLPQRLQEHIINLNKVILPESLCTIAQEDNV